MKIQVVGFWFTTPCSEVKSHHPEDVGSVTDRNVGIHNSEDHDLGI